MLKKVKKRLFAGAAAVVFALGGGVPALSEAGVRIDLPVFAAEIVDSGTCGENVTWTLDSEGALTISGTGEMSSYDKSSIRDMIKKVIINYGVTSIGDHAFEYCTSLESITIPDSVKSIGKEVFVYCENLASITIPNSVTSIGDCAFYECTSLESITIPSSVTSLGNSVFSGCIKLANITIPNSVTSIGKSAFSDCTSLIDIVIPDSVSEIGSGCFFNCTNLSSIQLSNNLTSLPTRTITYTPTAWTTKNYIYEGFFGNCTSLKNIIIPNSVTSIGREAFKNCRSIDNIVIPDSVEFMDSACFWGCSNLKTIKLPKNIKSLPSGTYHQDYSRDNYYRGFFNGCCKLEEITIPDSVTGIDADTFCGCSSLTSITIPNSVTSICQEAFYNCRSLMSISIPDNVKSIGDYSFSGCTNLTSITIPNSVTSLGNAAFSDCQNLESINIPDSITSIGYYAFKNCTSLASITIPNSVTSIGYSTFENCTSLASITIPNSVTKIDDSAFGGCSSLASITIPRGVTWISSSAFSNCTNLESIKVSNKNKEYASIDGVLYNKDLTSVIRYPLAKEFVSLPDSVTTIYDRAFEGLINLTSITIPNNVTRIGNHSFSGCINLTNVTIPNSVTSIGKYAFSNCSNLTNVTIPNSVTSIGEYAFANCSNLTNVTIPNSVTSIGEYAFYKCINLASVTIPNSVTNIGYEALGYYDSYSKVKGFKIYCYKDSAGEKYAIKYKFEYVLLDVDGIEGELTSVDPLNCVIKIDDKEYEVDDSFDFNSVMEWYVEATNKRVKVLFVNNRVHSIEQLEEEPPEIPSYMFFSTPSEQLISASSLTSLNVNGLTCTIDKPHRVEINGKAHLITISGNSRKVYDFPNIEIEEDEYSTVIVLENAYIELGTKNSIVFDKGAILIDGEEFEPLTKEGFWTFETEAAPELNITKSIMSLDDVWCFPNTGVSDILGEITKDDYSQAFKNFGLSPAQCDSIFKFVLSIPSARGIKGMCAGLSITAATSSWFKNPAVSSFENETGVKYTKLRDIRNKDDKSGNLSVEKYIKYAYIYQWSPSFKKEHKDDMKALYNAVNASMDLTGYPVYISISGSNFSHAVLAVGIGINNEEKTEIIVYDCNTPWYFKTLTLYKNTKGDYIKWTFEHDTIMRSSDMEGTMICFALIDDGYTKSLKNGGNNWSKDTKLIITDTILNAASIGTNSFLNDPIIFNYSSETGDNSSIPYCYWVQSDDEILFENGKDHNTVSVTSFTESIETTLPANAKLTVNVNDEEEDFAKVENISAGETAQINFVSYKDSTETEAITDTVQITVSGGSEVTATNHDGYVEVKGADEFDIVTTDNGEVVDTKHIVADEHSVKVEINDDATIKDTAVDTNDDGQYDDNDNDTEEFLPGDLNASGGKPDVEDLVLMQKLVAGWKVDDQIKTNADLDGSGGKPDVEDLVLLQKIVAGWKVDLDKIRLSR